MGEWVIEYRYRPAFRRCENDGIWLPYPMPCELNQVSFDQANEFLKDVSDSPFFEHRAVLYKGKFPQAVIRIAGEGGE